MKYFDTLSCAWFISYSYKKHDYEKKVYAIPPISEKRTITSHVKLLNTKQATTYDDRNPGSGLGQGEKREDSQLKEVQFCL